MYIIGQNGDANEQAGYLPSQVANTMQEKCRVPSQTFVADSMSWMEKTLRSTAAVKTPNAIVKKGGSLYNGKRYKFWKSRESGAWIWIWPERGFVHMERESDGYYKKWTLRDAVRFTDALGEQSEVTKWPDEKQHARNAYLILEEVCKEARRQGDPTEMTDEEKRALKESIACATVPHLGKITFVGGNVHSVENLAVSGSGVKTDDGE
jgi:hypothetical protein